MYIDLKWMQILKKTVTVFILDHLENKKQQKTKMVQNFVSKGNITQDWLKKHQ